MLLFLPFPIANDDQDWQPSLTLIWGRKKKTVLLLMWILTSALLNPMPPCSNHLIQMSSFCVLQLEKLIGKLKTEKYGGRILDQILKDIESEQPDGVMQSNDEGIVNRANKRLKSKLTHVIVESSGDEQE